MILDEIRYFIIDDLKLYALRDVEKYFNKNYSIVRYVEYVGETVFEKIHPIGHVKSKFINDSTVLKLQDLINSYTKKELQKLLLEDTSLKRYGDKHYVNVEKSKKTRLERYGDENYRNDEQIKKTCLERYGVDNPFASEHVRKIVSEKNKLNAKERCEKLKETNLKKYGAVTYTSSELGKQKIRETNLKKYGMYYVQTEEYKQRDKLNKQLKLEEIEKSGKVPLFVHGHDKGSILSLCEQLNIHIFIEYHGLKCILKEDMDKLINYLDDSGTSSCLELELVDFIKSVYDGEIIQSDRKIIAPKELDIYIPEKRVAIEFDGLYWHSELSKDKNYHLNKTLECEKQGIRLLHVFEDEWKFEKEKVKSIIKSSLGIYDRKIFARKCEFKQLSSKEYKDFVIANHLQSYAPIKYSYGLFYNDELVQCVGFSKCRFNHTSEYELIRMVTKLNTQIIGGFSKLMKNSCKELNVNKIYSYVDRRIFNGNGYFSSGYKILGYSAPSYQYIYHGKRLNRMNFQKKNLHKYFKDVDLSKSEHDICFENKVYRIYDCGTIKVLYEY